MAQASSAFHATDYCSVADGDDNTCNEETELLSADKKADNLLSLLAETTATKAKTKAKGFTCW